MIVGTGPASNKRSEICMKFRDDSDNITAENTYTYHRDSVIFTIKAKETHTVDYCLDALYINADSVKAIEIEHFVKALIYCGKKEHYGAFRKNETIYTNNTI